MTIEQLLNLDATFEQRATSVPGASCPRCGHELGQVASPDNERPPQENDLTMCSDCGLPLVFGPDMKLRAATFEECAPHILKAPVLLKVMFDLNMRWQKHTRATKPTKGEN